MQLYLAGEGISQQHILLWFLCLSLRTDLFYLRFQLMSLIALFVGSPVPLNVQGFIQHAVQGHSEEGCGSFQTYTGHLFYPTFFSSSRIFVPFRQLLCNQNATVALNFY